MNKRKIRDSERGINKEKVSTVSQAPSQAQDMPLKDSMLLSPIEKYKLYGRFPWKMVIHIFLVIATTSQAIMTVANTTQYTRAQERLFYNLFISDSDKTDLDYPRKAYLYSVSQLKDHISNAVHNFYSLRNDSLEIVEYLSDPANLYIHMQFSYYDRKLITSNAPIPREYVYKINNTSLGPFDYKDEEVKTFLNSVTDFQLNYTLRTYVPFFYGDNLECFHWDIIQNYNFIHRAHFVTKLQITRNVCSDRSNLTPLDYFINRSMWLHLTVIALAVVSLILTWKYVYKMAKLYWRMKRRNKDKRKQLDQEDSDEEERKKESRLKPRGHGINTDKKGSTDDASIYFNMWSIVCLVGNIIQIFGSSMSLFDTDNIMSITEILVGFGCMLAYINVGRYLEYNKDYSTIFATIKRAMPNVLRYLLGVMPIFFGFIFFGLCLFWRSERFTSTSSTMMTLFAMLNGDSVFDIFNDLTGVSFFLGQLYCYIFCIIFIVVVMNVFISIIEEAYVSMKMKNQNHWIYSYLKIDPKYVQIKDIDELEAKDTKPNIKDYQGANLSENNALINKYNKEPSQMISSIQSKNILREAITEKKVEKVKNVDNKQDVEKTLELHFINIEKSLNEVETISKEVASTRDTQMKDELRLTILDHITSLENKVTHLREVWFQQI